MSQKIPLPETTEDPTPDVSVVVIVYNDADRLPAAVESVLRQTLRGVEAVIVDDCSTDGSYQVAQALAATSPRRVRALRLPENSGGCGEPRNQGVGAARGRYVMFLDSDDVLDPDACRNMFQAATRTGADLVSGLCVRVQVDSRNRKTSEWYPWLYRRTRTLDSIAELPDLMVFDTLSTNKCYRRSFLTGQALAFPKGIHYEDLLFSAQAYLAAGRIALIPNRVYYWHVSDKAPAERSISNQRHEVNNFADRLEIHRRIDALLESRGLHELKLRKDTKFLKHDLVLYLRDLPFLDEDYRRRFTGMARSYIEGFPVAAYEGLDPIHRICAYLLAQDDRENLMPAIDTLINRSKLSSPLAERDGRVYWCRAHLDDERARPMLDVTALGYHTKPLGSLFLRNRLTGYDELSSGVRLSGALVNPLGRIAADVPLSAELVFSARRHGVRTYRFPVGSLRHAGSEILWEAAVPLARGFRPLGIVDEVWDVRLRLRAGDTQLMSRLTVDDARPADRGSLTVRPLLGRLTADHLEPEVSAKGHLAFRLTQRGEAARRTRAMAARRMRGPTASSVKSLYHSARSVRRRVSSPEYKIRAYRIMIRVLPVRKGSVVFESQLGKQYSDSPRAIYEELRRRPAPVSAIWSHDGHAEDFPQDAELVRRWSWTYLLALARAEFWIDNQGFPLKLPKRPGTTYIQTWHGSALKRMGFDEPALRRASADTQRSFQEAVDRFDHFVVRGEHDVRTLARAFRIPEERLLRTGYPRNDALVRARDLDRPPPEVQEAARRLGIRPGLPVLLYAPTFRTGPNGRVVPFTPPFDVERFAAELGASCTLLIRTHYLNQVTLPPSAAGRVIDVTAEHDITPLLLLSDALVTDYSSVMFDYALLHRPMIFFAYDWDEYAHDIRGTYVDLPTQAPGPVVRTEDEFLTAVADLGALHTRYATALKAFADRFGEYDNGDAASRIADRFFGTTGENR